MGLRFFCLYAVVLLTGTPALAEEGRPPVVASLRIRGNKAVSTGELKGLMYTRQDPLFSWFPGVKNQRFDPAVFRSDVARILSRYQDLGYYNAEADTTVERVQAGVRIEIRVREGEPVRVSALRVVGLPDDAEVDSARIRSALRTRQGRPLVRGNVDRDRDLILSRLQNSGYAFADVAVHRDVHKEALQAEVTFRVTHGPKCVFGRALVQGNQRVSAEVVRRGVTFREGRVFRKRRFLDSQRQLYRSGAFRSVSLTLPDSVEKASPVDVLVTVNERPPRSLKLGASYDTEEQVRGQVTWVHRNFLGGARQLGLDTEASALAASATLSLRQPYIWGSKTWLYLSGFVEQDRPEEVRVKRTGGSATLERMFRASGRLAFQVRTEFVDFATDSTRTNFRIEYQEDTRDDFFDPRRGLLALVAVQESGFLFKSRQEILKLTGEGRWYRRVIWRSVLAFRVAGGVIQELSGQAEVPNFERFFAGGARSVRGWELNQLSPRDAAGNPVGGLSLLEGSLELRTRLLSVLGTAVFLDGGNVGPGQFDAFDFARLKWSVGAGLRYLSPIGPLRLDVAYRLSGDPAVTRRRQLYFSLGQAF